MQNFKRESLLLKIVDKQNELPLCKEASDVLQVLNFLSSIKVSRLAALRFNKMKLYSKYISIFLLLYFLLYTPNAFAYIGPGLASGTVVSVLGILAGILMLIVGMVWYPIKRLYIRFIKKNKK